MNIALGEFVDQVALIMPTLVAALAGFTFLKKNLQIDLILKNDFSFNSIQVRGLLVTSYLIFTACGLMTSVALHPLMGFVVTAGLQYIFYTMICKYSENAQKKVSPHWDILRESLKGKAPCYISINAIDALQVSPRTLGPKKNLGH